MFHWLLPLRILEWLHVDPSMYICSRALSAAVLGFIFHHLSPPPLPALWVTWAMSLLLQSLGMGLCLTHGVGEGGFMRSDARLGTKVLRPMALFPMTSALECFLDALQQCPANGLYDKIKNVKHDGSHSLEGKKAKVSRMVSILREVSLLSYSG